MQLKNVTFGRHPASGFTLIELMIVVTIMAILALLGAPMYALFMANSQIRNAAESITGGLQLARAEAVKRNAPVAFVLNATTGWQVNDASNAPIAKHDWVDGSRRVVVTVTGTTPVQFDGLGRLRPNNTQATFDVTTSSALTDQRNLRVVVDPFIGIKLCDSHLPYTDPAGCPQATS